MTTCARRSRAATATWSRGTRGSCSCAGTTRFTPRPARRRRRARRARSRPLSVITRRGSGRRGGLVAWASSIASTPDWRDRVALPRVHATGLHVRRRAPGARTRIHAAGVAAGRVRRRRSQRLRGCRWTATSKKTAPSLTRAPETLVHQRVELRWDRDRVWVEHRGEAVARLRTRLRGRKIRPAPPAPTDASRAARELAPLIPITAPHNSLRPHSATTPSSAHDRYDDGGR